MVQNDVEVIVQNLAIVVLRKTRSHETSIWMDDLSSGGKFGELKAPKSIELTWGGTRLPRNSRRSSVLVTTKHSASTVLHASGQRTKSIELTALWVLWPGSVQEVAPCRCVCPLSVLEKPTTTVASTKNLHDYSF